MPQTQDGFEAFKASVAAERAEREARKTPEQRSKDVVQEVRILFSLGSHDSGKAAVDYAARKPWPSSVQDAGDYVRKNIAATTKAINSFKKLIKKNKK